MPDLGPESSSVPAAFLLLLFFILTSLFRVSEMTGVSGQGGGADRRPLTSMSQHQVKRNNV